MGATLGSHSGQVLLAAITLGLYWPAAYAAQQRWIAKNTLIDGKQLVFTGTAIGIFSVWLKILLLSIITAGIYAHGDGAPSSGGRLTTPTSPTQATSRTFDCPSFTAFASASCSMLSHQGNRCSPGC
ncbi:MAG TPA: DUF898 family protein [Candidatus Acetothermia bacterium]|nr:DUF898 family protein [Candidatus Acetothermia bacterium]